MESDYIQRIKTVEIPRLKLKLKEIEQLYGKFSERWHVANENLLNHVHLVKHGVPKNINQSTDIPYDLVEGF